jgi:hypothetical protein
MSTSTTANHSEKPSHSRTAQQYTALRAGFAAAARALADFEQRHAVSVSPRSLAYTDRWLRSPDPRLPLPDLRTWYREPGLWVPLSCAVSIVNGGAGHKKAAGSASTSTGNTVAFDSSGASLIVIGVGTYNAGAVNTNIVETGASPNSWTALTARARGTANVRLFYCKNPNTNASHQFAYTDSVAVYPNLFVIAVSGTDTTTPFETETSGSANSTVVNAGSLTPNTTGDFFVTVGNAQFQDFATIDSSYTVADHQANGGNNVGGGLAYFIATTTGAKNPQWTVSGVDDLIVAHAVFAIASGVGGGTFGSECFPPVGQPTNHYRPTIVM